MFFFIRQPKPREQFLAFGCRKKSLSSKPLEQDRADQTFRVSDFARTVGEAFDAAVIGVEVIVEVIDVGVISAASSEVVSSVFMRGRVYEISADSEYVEATYKTTLATTVEIQKVRLVDRAQNTMLRTLGTPINVSQSTFLGSPPSAIKVGLEGIAEVDVSARVTQGSPTLVGLERVRFQQVHGR